MGRDFIDIYNNRLVKIKDRASYVLSNETARIKFFSRIARIFFVGTIFFISFPITSIVFSPKISFVGNLDL